MADFEYGPVELFLIGFDGERPGPDVVAAIVELAESGTVQFLDLIFVTRALDGEVTVLELDELSDDIGLVGFELLELGLAGEQDVEGFADAVAPGTSAAILVVEHVWAREFAQALYRAGGAVLVSERIPAPVINEVVAETHIND
jgi:Family of unknown function (DUF6325)